MKLYISSHICILLCKLKYNLGSLYFIIFKEIINYLPKGIKPINIMQISNTQRPAYLLYFFSLFLNAQLWREEMGK